MKYKVALKPFFKGIHKGDTLILSTVLHEECQLRSVLSDSEDKTIIRNETMTNFKKSIASKPVSRIYEERILNYDIKIDGNMAVAYTPYLFYLYDQFLYCGVNVFVLVYKQDFWQILSITDTRRKENCLTE